jgi:hypothetical protein
MNVFVYLLCGAIALGAVLPISAGGTTLTEIQRVHRGELRMDGFVLDQDQEVHVEAVGLFHRSKSLRFLLSNTWILDADTRDVVWEFHRADAKRISPDMREFSGDVKLARGTYEVYYASYPYYRHRDFKAEGLGDLITQFVNEVLKRDYDIDDSEQLYRQFKIVIEGDGRRISRKDILEHHKRTPENAIVSVKNLRDARFEQIGFKLEKPMDVEIHAVGEAVKDEHYDYSWLINTDTRETVWKFSYWDSDHAGGAEKNRVIKNTLSLPAGSYAAFVAADDSHCFDEWNSPPPYDPMHWGVTIRTTDPKMARYVKAFEYEDVVDENVLLELTRLGDDAFESAGFTLKRPMKLRIYAFGEVVDEELYDYSWIVDADTREVVWKMDPRRSDHGGGAHKNQLVDEVMELNKGNYIAYAVTDGSHSYRDWNASPPYDPKRWGLTVMVPDGKSNRRDFSAYEESTDKAVIAQIVRVGNHANEKQRFSISAPTRIRVYALGEGQNGRMYDYAWIEEAKSGRVIWEMTYRMTEHAGGARKNRVCNATVSLDAGEYVVYYESDGSHSFNRWNAKPPADMLSWGITLKNESRQ